MEKTQNYGDAFDNYSYVRGASRVGEFEDDSISTLSSFHPLAISTSTKSGRGDVGSETFCQPNRFRLSLSSLITSDDDQENRGDTSSLGLLRSGQFMSESSVSKFQASGNRESVGWNQSVIQQGEFPDFSADLGGKDFQNNLDFIEKEEARNKADHPFIQEEVIGDTNGHYDTSSWSVSRALDTADDRPTGVLHTSNQSNVSVSSFFKRRSASLGHFNGSGLPSEERPSFGLTVVERKIIRHQSTSPVGSSISIGQYHQSGDGLPVGLPCLDSNLNAAGENSVMQGGKKALSDSAVSVSKEDQSSHHRSSHNRDRKRSVEKDKARLTTKPPRAPLKSQVPSPSCADSISGNDASVIPEKSAFNMTDSSSSFLSLTAIQTLLNDVSASGSASMLAKEIISKSEAIMRPSKKHGRKEEKTSAVASDTKRDAKKTSSTASQDKKDNVVPANVDALPAFTNVIQEAITEDKSRPHITDVQSSSTIAHGQKKQAAVDIPLPSSPENVIPPPKPLIAEVKSKPKTDKAMKEIRGPVTVERDSGLEEKTSKSGTTPADSIVVEMKVDGILYKGILYAQPSLPDSGRSSC